MAARLLRLSSFKGLQADRWGLLRSQSAVSFCTRTEDPTKPTKKKKAAVKTEAPDLRESLLAYKSAVSFPVRTPQPALLLTNVVGGAESASTSSSFPTGAPSEVESMMSSSPSAQVDPEGASPPAEEVGSGEVGTAAVPAATTEGAPTPETTDPIAGETSSSSDSESDSDSDSEDEKTPSAGPASSPKPQRPSAKDEERFPELTEEQAEGQGEQKVPASSHGDPPLEEPLHEGSAGSEKLEPLKPSNPQTTAEKVENVAVETPEEDAPAVHAAHSDAPSSPSLVQATAQDKIQTTGPADHPAEEPAVNISAVKRLDGAEAAEEPAEPQNPSAKVPEAQSEASSPAGVTENLVDPGQILEGAGELQLEEAAAPEPEEPFDNSTYNNYQHHSYNPYTFADLDLEMAKYRLPQPSSGRPSPRH